MPPYSANRTVEPLCWAWCNSQSRNLESMRSAIDENTKALYYGRLKIVFEGVHPSEGIKFYIDETYVARLPGQFGMWHSQSQFFKIVDVTQSITMTYGTQQWLDIPFEMPTGYTSIGVVGFYTGNGNCFVSHIGVSDSSVAIQIRAYADYGNYISVKVLCVRESVMWLALYISDCNRDLRISDIVINCFVIHRGIVVIIISVNKDVFYMHKCLHNRDFRCL